MLSDEIFELANRWINECNEKCQCANLSMSPKRNQFQAEGWWLPKRLLDLRRLRNINGVQRIGSLTFQSQISNVARERIKLIEPRTNATVNKNDVRYATLSHCWGKPHSVKGQLKLTEENEARFKDAGIELRELPKTFRDAVLVASRLEGVEYLWIDSLCIKQRPTDGTSDNKASERDWLEQSREMDRIYRYAYLNISATIAIDSDQGLFYQRNPEELWEDEVSLNVTDLITSKEIQWSATESIFSFPRGKTNSADDCILRCVIIDVTFWACLIEDAPVNRRAWVLQERLMAPRVLHFCRNQIAWECSTFQDAEAYPKSLPPLTLRHGDIFEDIRIKCLVPETGLKLRELRLNGFNDPDKHIENLGAYELWKRVVEMYSKTLLTISDDKLLALAGLAKHFQQWTNCEYVAGMWRTFLESQLLWHVNEVFRDGNFEVSAKRVPRRAPSFSWASIDAPCGITYGEATDYKDDELFIRVDEYNRDLYDPKNQFGMLQDGYGFLMITPTYLHSIEVEKLQPPHRVPYCWNLKGNKKRKLSNMYLDAPVTDLDVFKPNAELFCMPVAYGERTVERSSRYLICLLLMKIECEPSSKTYMRIGLTKLSKFRDYDVQEELVGKDATKFKGWIKIY
ncbi:uncharacterized protein PV09_03608 [Verruconis gallopava]|uniref:Heterokaryon incompatibility domain-containing protein n=1 Tax=Verruconis gallopava TaxID=253628 RepID=A0A0D1YYG8_9PEZI|nr:uncharacterized protein PV09_03608 [Verruconis gallopava]KIW05752.1 hypothetical protein PV09_03608 [Verruconis gallopava]